MSPLREFLREVKVARRATGCRPYGVWDLVSPLRVFWREVEVARGARYSSDTNEEILKSLLRFLLSLVLRGNHFCRLGRGL